MGRGSHTETFSLIALVPKSTSWLKDVGGRGDTCDYSISHRFKSSFLFFFDGLGWTWTWGLGLGLDNKDFLKNEM